MIRDKATRNELDRLRALVAKLTAESARLRKQRNAFRDNIRDLYNLAALALRQAECAELRALEEEQVARASNIEIEDDGTSEE